MKERSAEWRTWVTTSVHSDHQLLRRPLGVTSDWGDGGQSGASITHAGVKTHLSHGGLGGHDDVQLNNLHKNGSEIVVT